MVSLTDAGRLVRQVVVGEKTVPIYGVNLEDLVKLLDRFPEFKELITPKRGSEGPSFTVEGLLKMGPRIVGAVIAAGLGEAGSEDTENMAKILPIGLQIKIIREIMDLTFPGGLGPFVEDLRSMGLLPKTQEVGPSASSSLNGASDGTGKAPAMSSSLPPPDSEPRATPT